MLTRQTVLDALRPVIDPESGVSVVDLGMVREISVREGHVQVEVTLAVPLCALASPIADRVGKALLTVPGVKVARVTLVPGRQYRRPAAANTQQARSSEGRTPPPQVLLLTAPSGQGKTTACQRVVELARSHGLRVGGLLSLPVVQDSAKTAITLRDVGTGRERVLAHAHQASDGPRVGVWTFDPASLAWGQRVLASTPPCDLLVVDEIGPLELEIGQGLAKALDVLRRGTYCLALVTMRPALVKAITAQLEGLEVSVMRLDERNRDRLPQTIVVHCFELKR